MTLKAIRSKFAALAMAAACAVLAACSATATHSAPTPHDSATSPPAPASHAPHIALPPNVSLSPQAGSLPPGPLTIKVVSCGAYTQAQRNSLGTNARGGLVYDYTGRPGTKADGGTLDVEFLKGARVAGENVAGDPPPVAAGQTATDTVDAVGGSGGNLSFTSCELLDYAVITSAGGQPGTYAP